MDDKRYINTRAELDSALDGELGHVRNMLNQWWFKQQDAARELSEIINDLWQTNQRLSRMLTETDDQALADLLSAASNEEDQDH